MSVMNNFHSLVREWRCLIKRQSESYFANINENFANVFEENFADFLPTQKNLNFKDYIEPLLNL